MAAKKEREERAKERAKLERKREFIRELIRLKIEKKIEKQRTMINLQAGKIYPGPTCSTQANGPKFIAKGYKIQKKKD